MRIGIVNLLGIDNDQTAFRTDIMLIVHKELPLSANKKLKLHFRMPMFDHIVFLISGTPLDD